MTDRVGIRRQALIDAFTKLEDQDLEQREYERVQRELVDPEGAAMYDMYLVRFLKIRRDRLREKWGKKQ